jgi:hypothetical protein
MKKYILLIFLVFFTGCSRPSWIELGDIEMMSYLGAREESPVLINENLEILRS